MTGITALPQAFRILLVEDNPGDVRLVQEALQTSCIPHSLCVATTGEQALQILIDLKEHASEGMDLILLDLNLPGIQGLDILVEIKTDTGLSTIPVLILSTSSAVEEIARAYDAQANCFITKPLDMEGYFYVLQGIVRFWGGVVKRPRRNWAGSYVY
ncbi:MAG: response regulator [Anaerolineales bacterium]|nr:response regulator [Anaerolineales bacterium]